MRAGVIVAGGRSTRFEGGDKVVADLAGVPMIRRVVDRLTDVIDELVVNCREDQRQAIADALAEYPHDVTFAIDPEPGLGPMAGIRTGLSATRAEYAFVAAGDMPFLEDSFVGYLFDRAAGHDAALPKTEDGYFEPLHAVYRVAPMVRACDAALDRDERRIVAPLPDLEYVEVGPSEIAAQADPRTFENVNTRGELTQAAERLG
ncbi:MAG: molybdopterin-guanine dinucleotide biosynthesis protein A [Halobacteriales archaeon]|jgi:molybdopterin-guanine dinucleotide biosynthesis protein A